MSGIAAQNNTIRRETPIRANGNKIWNLLAQTGNCAYSLLKMADMLFQAIQPITTRPVAEDLPKIAEDAHFRTWRPEVKNVSK